MKSSLSYLLTGIISLLFSANYTAQSVNNQSENKEVIKEADAPDLFMEPAKSDKQKKKNQKEIKGALKATFQTNAKKGVSIIIETGTINSFVTEPNTNPTSESNPMNFLAKSDSYTNLGGVSAGIKVAKNILPPNSNRNVSIDLISGLVYKYTRTHQNGMPNYMANGLQWCGNGEIHRYVRDIKTKSIEIPLELRVSYQVNRFMLSPTIGVGFDIPHHIHYTNYNYEVKDNEYIKTDIINYRESKGGQTNINLMSKLELAYQLHNDHKLKLACFYNANLSSKLVTAFYYGESISSQGLQLSYELPIGFKEKK